MRWEPSSTPLFTLSGFIVFIAVYTIALTVPVSFYSDDCQEPDLTFWETIKGVKLMFTNRNLLTYLALSLVAHLPTAYFGSIIGYRMFDKGYSTEESTFVSTCVTFVEMVLIYIFPFAIKRLFSGYFITQILAILFGLINYAILVNFEWLHEDKTYFFVLMFVISLIESYVHSVGFNAMSGMNFKISDKAIGGTAITFINGTSNLCRAWPRTLVLKVAGDFKDSTMVFASVSSAILIYGGLFKYVSKMDDLTVQDWRIEEKKKEE